MQLFTQYLHQEAASDEDCEQQLPSPFLAANKMVSSTFRVDLPVSINLIYKTPQRCAQKCVLSTILAPVKLTVDTSHPVGQQ